MSKSYHGGSAFGDFTGVFGDLVNEDALGVDVLGPRLAVEGHLLLLRKLNLDLFVISLNWTGTCTFSSLDMALALERSRVRLLGVSQFSTKANLISDLLVSLHVLSLCLHGSI